MPVKRRREKGRRSKELTERIEYGLRTGHFFFHEFTDEVIADLWERFRDEVLEDFIAEFPGTRPAAWWKFDAPEKLRRHIGGGIPANLDPDSPQWVKDSIWFGECSCIGKKQFDNPPEIESETDYLRRHKLLTREEKIALASTGGQAVKSVLHLRIDESDHTPGAMTTAVDDDDGDILQSL